MNNKWIIRAKRNNFVKSLPEDLYIEVIVERNFEFATTQYPEFATEFEDKAAAIDICRHLLAIMNYYGSWTLTLVPRKR